VSPILGIWASQNYSRYSLPTSFESIATATVGSGGSSTITFSSIPSTYTHLQLRGIAREKAGSGSLYNLMFATFNSDTGSNYSYHYLRGSGSAAAAGAGASQTSMSFGGIEQGDNTASTFGANVIDILDYANTNKYKTIRSLFGYDANGSGYIVFSSDAWRSTSAVTSITLTPANGFAQYSTFALYGIKGGNS
jgi:hypothetical protein